MRDQLSKNLLLRVTEAKSKYSETFIKQTLSRPSQDELRCPLNKGSRKMEPIVYLLFKQANNSYSCSKFTPKASLTPKFFSNL